MGDYQIDLKFIILLIFKRLALIRMIINFKSILIYLSYNVLLTGNFPWNYGVGTKFTSWVN